MVSFSKMEKWFPEVNWLIGEENDFGYNMRDFIYIGINMKNKKIAIGAFSSGTCDQCGYKDYEKDSINYIEEERFDFFLLDKLRSCLKVYDDSKDEIVQSLIDKIRNLAGYKIPLYFEDREDHFHFRRLK